MFSKGIVHLIEAFKLLPGENILNIYGDVMSDEFKTKTEMNTIIQKYSNVKGLSYHGVASRDQIADILKAHEIFVLPTFYSSEAAPLSVLEAMKYNCCVILTEHKMLRQVYGEFDITWIKKRSIKDLLNALKSIECSEKGKHLNYTKIHSHYSIEGFTRNMKSILFN